MKGTAHHWQRLMAMHFYLWLVCRLWAEPGTNQIPEPVTARDYYNAGTRWLQTTNLGEAERLLVAALAQQDESIQPLAEYNLGTLRFTDGQQLLKQGPDAQKLAGGAQQVLNAGETALRDGESALASAVMERMIDAYLEGKGARRDLRTAEKAVKSALQTYAKTLNRWQRSLADFQGALEMNPADHNASTNAALVEKYIARLVDQMQVLQQMAAQMGAQKDQLGKMLSKLKGQIPAPNAPPGGKGEEDEDKDDEGQDPGGMKPESLAGKQENSGVEGEELKGRLSPDKATQMMDGLPVDYGKPLPIFSDKEGKPVGDRKGRNW
ncbi:MAG TPA: hypothetical protein VF607_03945 [Verrucomicrobiae bacterium]